MPHEPLLQIRLRVFVAEPEKFQHEGMTDFFLGGDRVAGLFLRALGQHRDLVPRERGALVELTVDLPLELPHGPAAAQGFGVIE